MRAIGQRVEKEIGATLPRQMFGARSVFREDEPLGRDASGRRLVLELLIGGSLRLQKRTAATTTISR